MLLRVGSTDARQDAGQDREGPARVRQAGLGGSRPLLTWRTGGSACPARAVRGHAQLRPIRGQCGPGGCANGEAGTSARTRERCNPAPPLRSCCYRGVDPPACTLAQQQQGAALPQGGVGGHSTCSTFGWRRSLLGRARGLRTRVALQVICCIVLILCSGARSAAASAWAAEQRCLCSCTPLRASHARCDATQARL